MQHAGNRESSEQEQGLFPPISGNRLKGLFGQACEPVHKLTA